jgi:hypothetical protein
LKVVERITTVRALAKTFPLSEVEALWAAANSMPRSVFQML